METSDNAQKNDFAFMYNPQSRIITIRNNNWTGTYVNADHEFLYNGESFMLVNLTTTLVKHATAGFGDLEVKYFDYLVAMRKDDAIKNKTNLINALQNNIQVTKGTEPLLATQDLSKTIELIKSRILQKLQAGESQIQTNIRQGLQILISRVKDFKMQEMVNSLPNTTKIDLNYPGNTSDSTIISDLAKYIMYHNNYHPSTVNNRMLCTIPDTVFLLTLVDLLMDTYTVRWSDGVNLTTTQDIMVHTIIEALFNMMTMRIDRELFVQERNEAAKKIKRRYYTNFPILTKNKSIDELLFYLNNDTKFMKEIESESVKLFPFIALYGLSDKQRVATCYNKCRNNKEVNDACDNRINWLSTDKFIQLLQQFSIEHSQDFMRYDTDLFVKLVENFIVPDAQPHNLEDDYSLTLLKDAQSCNLKNGNQLPLQQDVTTISATEKEEEEGGEEGEEEPMDM